MFANYFVSKIDSLKSAIISQLTDIVPPPSDPVCCYPSMQLLEPVTSFEVCKLLAIIPPKSCCLDYIPTAIIKKCSPVFSDLIAYLANLSFAHGIFPSNFKHASVTPLHISKSQAWIHLSSLIFDLFPISITYPKFLKGFFLHVCNHISLSCLVSILCNQPIASITPLKPLSFTSSILSIMQPTKALPPYFSLLTSVLPLIPLIIIYF